MIRTTLLAALFTTTTLTGGNKPKAIVIAADPELIPEGIAVHPQQGTIYLSSLHQNKIVAVNKKGVVRDLIPPNAENFMMGLGMKIDAAGKTLWACTAFNDSITHKTGLYQVDLQTGKVLQKFMRNEQKNCFLNDLVIDRKGNIYMTDSEQSAVFRWDALTSTLKLWLQDEKLQWPNGIALSPDEQTLFVASAINGIQKININTRTIAPIAGKTADFYFIDGLAWYQNSLIGVIGWPQDQPSTHRVLRFHLTANHDLRQTDTIDINNPQMNCPTTVAIAGNQAYVLARTNLGVYNRHNGHTKNIRDSLQNPVVLQYVLDN